MYNHNQVVRAALRILRKYGIRQVCTNLLKDYPQEMDNGQFCDCVMELVDDTWLWEM
jgi:hypothetical protein